MEQASSLIDRLYTRYLLRDFVAKIVPGLLVLVAFGFSADHPLASVAFMHRLPAWSWIFILGVSFIVGFSVQAIGELTGWTRIYSDGNSRKPEVREKAIDRMIKLHKRDLPWANQQRERFVVLKEMAGNSSLAIVISIAFIVLATFSNLAAMIGKALFVLLSLLSFLWYNRMQAEDQCYLEEQSSKGRSKKG